ncbi:ELMO domain-containing protein 3-like [Tetranychus urticae]|uniref:ELMO domain-containing protein 3-like n=1 Tax=Tetranychus urticae TaxID=32264 RepID=UPI00077C0B0E|nr:ELMO domain-containing protein 3-like [Tetranychus urticae]
MNQPDDLYREAFDEWNQINVIPIIDLSGEESSVNHVNTEEANQSDLSEGNVNFGTPLIYDNVGPVCLEEVDQYFGQLDLSQYEDKIVPVKHYSFLQRITRRITFKEKCLKKSLISERNKIFCLALVPFDNCNPWHYRFLITIYQQLTNCNPNEPIPRTGPHWETIGFQGIDPATDLRGVGIFALYQLLYLTLLPECSLLCHDIYSLSLDAIQQFPFAAMSTNITAIVLQLLRSGKLNRYLNAQCNALKVANSLYCDLYYQLIKIWSEKRATIKDAGFILKEVKIKCNKHLNKVIGSSAGYGVGKDGRLQLKQTELIQFSNLGNVFDDN